MDMKEWNEWQALYEDYEAKRQSYEKAHDNVRGTFSELARQYKKDAFDQNGFVRERQAHEEFMKAREKLHAFIETHVTKS